MKVRQWLVASLLALAGFAASAAFLEQEVSISEGEIQAAIDRHGPVEKRYGGLMTVGLPTPPQISLGEPGGKVRVVAQVTLTSPPARQPVPVDVVAASGLRYDDASKAFYLDNPVAESVTSPQLGREAEGLARQAVGMLLANYFRNRPVYVLREDGSFKERAARWMLRSIRIEPGRVVATLSPF